MALTIIPVPWRDYNSKQAVIDDFEADKDFHVSDISSRWNGCACNKTDLIEAGTTEIKVRYNRLQSVVYVYIIKSKNGSLTSRLYSSS